MNVEERLVSSLLRLSNDVSFMLEDGTLKLEPQHHRLLCEMVGATRESITLALSRMISAGAAVRRGTTFVVSPKRLTDRVRAAQYDTATPLEVVREMGA
jgi:hypothetical protein